MQHYLDHYCNEIIETHSFATRKRTAKSSIASKNVVLMFCKHLLVVLVRDRGTFYAKEIETPPVPSVKMSTLVKQSLRPHRPVLAKNSIA